MALCKCGEAALCETSETQDVTLEGRVCFDFLKAEDRETGESWRHRSHAARMLPQGLIAPLCQPSIYQLPHKHSDSSWSRSLHKQNICFQILKPKSVAEKDIQVLNGLEREGWFLLMSVCTHQASSVNKLVPATESSQGFQQQVGETGTEKEKAKSAPLPGTWELKEEQIRVTGPKMVSLFHHVFAELVQSFPYTLMQHPNNFVLERGDRAKQLFSNSSLFTEILI